MPTTTTTIPTVAWASQWDPSDFVALLALVVAMVVPALTFNHEHRLRRDDRAEARRREAALILGPAFALVHDYETAALADLENVEDAGAVLERMSELSEFHDREAGPP